MGDYSELKQAATKIVEVQTSEEVPISKLFDEFGALASPETVLEILSKLEIFQKAFTEKVVDQSVCKAAGYLLAKAEAMVLGNIERAPDQQVDQLKAEVARLTADNASLRGSCAKLGAEHAGMVRTVRKVNLENASLRGQVDTVAGWHASALNDAESMRKDKDRLDALEANFWDVRHTSTQVGMEGDTSQSIEIVGSWMDAPRERVIGENYNENLRAAIDQAMTADAYPPARPEYPEPDDEIPDFTRGSGKKARRRAELLGVEYPAAANTSDKP